MFIYVESYPQAALEVKLTSLFPRGGGDFSAQKIRGVGYLSHFQIIIFIARFYAELRNPSGHTHRIRRCHNVTTKPNVMTTCSIG